MIGAVALIAMAVAAEPAGASVSGIRSADQARCIYAGQWPTGMPLHYQAWDRCAKMRVRQIGRSEAIELAQGEEERLAALADVPANARLLELNNGISRVLLYRSGSGKLIEIPFGD